MAPSLQGVFPPLPLNLSPIRETAKDSAPAALGKGVAEASESADAVTGTGSLNVLRYGHILQARSLVGVRGAGLAFDGLYYVSRVTHEIRRGSYKQAFELARNALISTIPTVPA